jgi:hypothetical protein
MLRLPSTISQQKLPLHHLLIPCLPLRIRRKRESTCGMFTITVSYKASWVMTQSRMLRQKNLIGIEIPMLR